MFSQLQLLDWLLKDSRKLISKKMKKMSPGQLQNISIYLYAVYKIILLDQLFVFPAHVSPIMLLVIEIRIYF